MEVHPPDHAIHSWRDFFIHIATIVVGLLIAIGLEQSVEALHHRHLLHQAREQIHEELAANRKTVTDDEHFLSVAEQDSRGNIAVLSGTTAKGTPLQFGWRWDSPQSSAWTTARETGALSLMPYDEVQSLANIYSQQEIVDTEAAEHIRHYTQSLAPLMRHGALRDVPAESLSAAEREQLASSFAVNLTEISALTDMLHSLDGHYAHLQGER